MLSRSVTSLSFDTVQPILIDRVAAAQYLGISVRSLDYLIADKRIKGVRRNGRRVLLQVQQLRQYAERDHPERIRPILNRDNGSTQR